MSLSLFSDLGRNPSVLSVEDGVARVCRGNGSILHLSIAVFPEKLLKHVATNLWQVALQVNKNYNKYKNPSFSITYAQQWISSG